MNHFRVGAEEYPWSREPDASASRRQRLAARGPYAAALPARIADVPVRLDPALLAEAEDAVREIARFDAELAVVAAQRFAGDDGAAAELAPLAAVLLRTESASSSQIEGITAGARALALAALDARTGPNARLVTANVTAMRRAVDLADDLGTTSLLAVHEELLRGHEYAEPGRLRAGQVWIGSSALSPHTATFVPPHPTRVTASLDDLEVFIDRTDVPVLVHCAIAHAQFETIHPFADGNGRVGRALVHAMLRRAGVTRRLTVPVSAGLLTDTRAYVDSLMSYRDGDLAPIVQQFVGASFRAVGNGRQLVGDLTEVHESWTRRLSARRGSAARRMLPHLLNEPAVDVARVQLVTGVALSAAQRAVAQLEDDGILTRVGSGRRHRIWLAQDVTDALDAFAERAGRRS